MNMHWFAACAAFLVYAIISLEIHEMLRGIGNLPFWTIKTLPQSCGAACNVNMSMLVNS